MEHVDDCRAVVLGVGGVNKQQPESVLNAALQHAPAWALLGHSVACHELVSLWSLLGVASGVGNQVIDRPTVLYQARELVTRQFVLRSHCAIAGFTEANLRCIQCCAALAAGGSTVSLLPVHW
jgi:hypothetical protein